MTDKVSVSMPKDIKEHLFDLENSNGDIDMKLDMNRVKNNLDFMEEEEDDFVALLLNQMSDKSMFKKPSLDQILDKMLNGGFESLTQFEKDILDNYSKK
jgi:tRNA G26 N,N-dimethylase Trm1